MHDPLKEFKLLREALLETYIVMKGVEMYSENNVDIIDMNNGNNPEDTKWLKWYVRHLEHAKFVSQYSKDPSTKVGAVIADKNNIILGIGYNGFARGVDDSEERYNDRPTKYKFVVHAELNAILNTNQSIRNASSPTIFVWPSLMIPNACPECAKAIVQSGIKKVVGYYPDELNDRWAKDQEISNAILHEGGVKMLAIKQKVNENTTESS